MKHLLSILLLCLATLQAQAQSPEAVLKTAHTRFAAYKTYSCTLLTEVMGSGHPDPGQVYFSQGRYHLDFPGDLTISDGNTIMTWHKESGTASLNATIPDQDFTLQGMYTLYQRPYQFAWSDTTGPYYTMVLSTSNPQMPIPQVTLSISKTSYLIENYSMIVPQVGIYTYRILNPQADNPLDDALFQINWKFYEDIMNGKVAPKGHSHGHDHDHSHDHGHPHDH